VTLTGEMSWWVGRYRRSTTDRRARGRR